MKLTKKKFREIITNIVSDINKIHQRAYFTTMFDDGKCLLIPDRETLSTLYFDKFNALCTLYDCSFWVEIYKNKPCVRLLIN